MEEFALQLADEVSGRVREKVVSFFDVPQRVVPSMLSKSAPDIWWFSNPTY